MNKRRGAVLVGIVVLSIVACTGLKGLFDTKATKERQTRYKAETEELL